MKRLTSKSLIALSFLPACGTAAPETATEIAYRRCGVSGIFEPKEEDSTTERLKVPGELVERTREVSGDWDYNVAEKTTRPLTEGEFNILTETIASIDPVYREGLTTYQIIDINEEGAENLWGRYSGGMIDINRNIETLQDFTFQSSLRDLIGHELGHHLQSDLMPDELLPYTELPVTETSSGEDFAINFQKLQSRISSLRTNAYFEGNDFDKTDRDVRREKYEWLMQNIPNARQAEDIWPNWFILRFGGKLGIEVLDRDGYEKIIDTCSAYLDGQPDPSHGLINPLSYADYMSEQEITDGCSGKIDVLRSALTEGPLSEESVFHYHAKARLADLYAMNSRNAEAEASYQEVIRWASEKKQLQLEVESMLMLAEVHSRQGNLSEAQAIANEISSRYPDTTWSLKAASIRDDATN